MGKLTDEQRQQLADLQALADAPDDPELELYVKDEKGRETRLTGSHAQQWLKNLGLGGDEGDGAGDGAGAGDGDDKGDGAGDGDGDDKGGGKKPPKWFR